MAPCAHWGKNTKKKWGTLKKHTIGDKFEFLHKSLFPPRTVFTNRMPRDISRPSGPCEQSHVLIGQNWIQ